MSLSVMEKKALMGLRMAYPLKVPTDGPGLPMTMVTMKWPWSNNRLRTAQRNETLAGLVDKGLVAMGPGSGRPRGTVVGLTEQGWPIAVELCAKAGVDYPPRLWGRWQRHAKHAKPGGPVMGGPEPQAPRHAKPWVDEWTW